MNKKLWILAGLIVLSGAALKASWVYNTYLVNEPALAYSRNYTLNLNTTPNAAGIMRLSAQAVYSEANPASVNFTDGSLSTGTFTAASTNNLVAAKASDSITLSNTAGLQSVNATDSLVVLTTSSLSGKYVIYNGNYLKGNRDWTVVATTSGTAANIATAINRYYGVIAVSTNSTVNLTATPAGAAGNSKTLSVATSSITVASANFTGGLNAPLANAYLIVNGIRLRQGYDWFSTGTSSGTATSIAAVMNELTGLNASAAGSVIFATATVAGSAGNNFTILSSTPSYMTATSANFTGGQDNASICVNSLCVVQGINWTAQGTSSGNAKAISNAFMASAPISSIIKSTWTAGGVVFATSTSVGLGVNYSLSSSTPTAIVPSGATMSGGSASSWTINTPIIGVPSHGLTTALPILYSTGTIAIGGLKNQTTYYAIRIDANDFELASTSTGAVAGSYITLTSSSTTGPHTYTLAPLAYNGPLSMAWYGSIDGVNYNPVNVSSVTVTLNTTPTATLWDFGVVNYKYMQLSVVAPTQGGANLVVTVNGKD